MWWWCCIFSSSYTVLMQSSVSTMQQEHGQRRVNRKSKAQNGKLQITCQNKYDLHVLKACFKHITFQKGCYTSSLLHYNCPQTVTTLPHQILWHKYILCVYVFYVQYIFIKSLFFLFNHQCKILFYSVTFVTMTFYITWFAICNVLKDHLYFSDDEQNFRIESSFLARN